MRGIETSSPYIVVIFGGDAFSHNFHMYDNIYSRVKRCYRRIL